MYIRGRVALRVFGFAITLKDLREWAGTEGFTVYPQITWTYTPNSGKRLDSVQIGYRARSTYGADSPV